MVQVFVVAVLAQGFMVKGVEDGVEVAWRAVPGSSWAELRFVGAGRGEVEVVCARAFVTTSSDEPHLVSRKVLDEQPDLRLTWDVIAPPMVSRRDFVVRRVRTRESGRCRVDFEAVDDPRWPAQESIVRLRSLRGSFLIEPLPGGGVRIEHRVHMDPGGLLTPLVVDGTRERMGLSWMKRLLGR